MQNSWHIKNGRIVDPANNKDEIADLLILNGEIADNSTEIPENIPTIDASNLVITPGFIDLHVHFREPGFTEAEDIESGSKSAAKGGFTSVLMMPNTKPPLDTAERIIEILASAQTQQHVHIMTSACITSGREGKKTANLESMVKAGAIAFTDDGSTVPHEDTMKQAMEIAAMLDIPIMDHALDPDIAGKGVMHDGEYSKKHNLPGIPSKAESIIVKRDIKLSKETNCAIHIQHISAKESVALIKSAQQKGIQITAEATPHHLSLTDADIDPKNSNYKMNPPLRSEEDRRAIIDAVADGTIQTLATDHAPYTQANKDKGFTNAPFGVIGLETAIGITYSTLVQTGIMTDTEWIKRWTLGPAKILNLHPPTLAPGKPANITILDLNSEIIISTENFLSKSKNTPFNNKKVFGKAKHTFYKGIMTWSENSEHS